jgi:hypothetical protein
VRELAMKFLSGTAVRRVRFFGCIEDTQGSMLTVTDYLCSPTILVRRSSFETVTVVLVQSSVGFVITSASQAQVASPVVKTITIDVVHL